MENLVEIEALSFSYKWNLFVKPKPSDCVLKDVIFNISKGDSVAIVGKNGAGKSTLLKLIAGIYKPCRGSIINRAERTLMLSLHAGFEYNLSGRDNIIMSALIMGVGKAELKQAINKIIDYSELGEKIDMRIKYYSSGMILRLAFSIALFLHSELILIDEVLGVGDLEFQKKSYASMKAKMHTDDTIIMISHNLKALRELSTKAIWFEDGIVKMYGPKDEVLDEYERKYG